MGLSRNRRGFPLATMANTEFNVIIAMKLEKVNEMNIFATRQYPRQLAVIVTKIAVRSRSEISALIQSILIKKGPVTDRVKRHDVGE
jgi:hypothetical protein